MARVKPSVIPCPVSGCAYEAYTDQDKLSHIGHMARQGDGAHQAWLAKQAGSPPVAAPPPAAKPPPVAQAPTPPPVAAQVPKPAPPPQAAPSPTPPQAARAAWHPALYIPDPEPTFWMARLVRKVLVVVLKQSDSGGIVNVMLTGPAGSGKSTVPAEFAAASRRPFFGMECGAVSEGSDWWGEKELDERHTYVNKAALVDALETPGCVIRLDEVNRTHPENANHLFALLDHRRRTWVPLLHREVKVAPGVVIFATLNEGADFIGTNQLDHAFRDRFTVVIRTGYPPEKVELAILASRTKVPKDVAERVVKFANNVRYSPTQPIPVSTRQEIATCELVGAGMPLEEAIIFTVVNHVSEEVDKKALLQSLQMTVGKVDEAYVTGGQDKP